MVDIDRCLTRSQGDSAQARDMLQERQALAVRAVRMLCVPLLPAQKKGVVEGIILGAAPAFMSREAQEGLFAKCMRRTKARNLLARLIPLLPADLAAAVVLCVVRTFPDSICLPPATTELATVQAAGRLGAAAVDVIRTLPLPAVVALLRSLLLVLSPTVLCACLQQEAALTLLHVLAEQGSTHVSNAGPEAQATVQDWTTHFTILIQRIYAQEPAPSPDRPAPQPCFVQAATACSTAHLWGLTGYLTIVSSPQQRTLIQACIDRVAPRTEQLQQEADMLFRTLHQLLGPSIAGLTK
eukprot:GAFH01002682.1.p2 GENE.GAFH01002682.1~~GAFH01002682.1.p2  ORF type:complete len:340 (-),score=172.89 GAFH01002682.1:82-972(-)